MRLSDIWFSLSSNAGGSEAVNTTAIRANVSGNDIYTALQGLFVSVALRSRLQSFGPGIAGQLVVEFTVALGLSLLVHHFARQYTPRVSWG